MRRYLPVLILTIVTLLSACAQREKAAEAVRNVTVSEAYQWIQEHPGAVVIDVRTSGEFNGPLGHIAGARLLPVQEIETWSGDVADLKDSEIVLVCHSGARSSRAAEFLKSQGFQHLINVTGGMSAWAAAGYPVERDE